MVNGLAYKVGDGMDDIQETDQTVDSGRVKAICGEKLM